MTKFCIIEGCDEPISDRSSLDTCATCRRGLYYWQRRRPAEILERRRRLTMYNSRMGVLVGTNVVHIRRGRKPQEGLTMITKRRALKGGRS